MRHLPAVLCLSLSVAVAGCDAASRSALAASSDAATATPGPVPGSVGTLVIEAATVPAGPSFKVTVTDADQNLDPASRDAVTVHAMNATTGTDFESFILRETGANTGVFEGSVAVGTAKADDTVQVADGDTVLVEYRDRNTTASAACSWQPVPKTAVVNAVLPDLRFESVTIAPSVVGGNVLQIAGTISNHNAPGAATAAATRVHAVVGVWRMNYEDGPWFSVLKDLGTATIDALEAGQSQGFSFQYAPDAGQVQVVVRLTVDEGNLIRELNEDNNLVDRSVTVIGPDLVVENLTVSQPSQDAGGTVVVSGDVVNLPGGAAAPATTVGVVLGAWKTDYDGTWWTQPSTATVVQAPIVALAAGPTAENPNANRAHFTISYTVPTNLNGAYVIRATADANGVVRERDESNNFTYADLGVVGADLLPSDLVVTPVGTATPEAGGVVRLTGFVRNAEGGPAAVASVTTVSFGEMIDDWGYIYFSEIWRAPDQTMPAIGAGSSEPIGAVLESGGIGLEYKIPLGSGGDYVFQVVADAPRGVAERNEQNNLVYVPVRVKGANLYLCALPDIIPSPLIAGQPVTLRGRVCNAPGAPAPSSNVTVSFGQTVDDPWYGPEYTLYWSTTVKVPEMDGGGSQPFDVSFTPNVAPGAYTFGIVVDSAKAIREENESDNSTSVPVTVN